MKIHIYQVDAFTDTLFKGNPAAVCPLQQWLSDKEMQDIAAENNLSETAFFVKVNDEYELRWFTPTVEVDLCGHATLASAHVLYKHMGYVGKEVKFQTKSGLLTVRKDKDHLIMNFPADATQPAEAPSVLFQALGVRSDLIYRSDDYMVVLENEASVANLVPDFKMLAEVDARGIIVTAPGDHTDFVSRFFAPQSGVDEDPVTGSAHTKLAPYWAKRLDKTVLTARQISQRGGDLVCEFKGDRVEIKGRAVSYMKGEIAF